MFARELCWEEHTSCSSRNHGSRAAVQAGRMRKNLLTWPSQTEIHLPPLPWPICRKPGSLNATHGRHPIGRPMVGVRSNVGTDGKSVRASAQAYLPSIDGGGQPSSPTPPASHRRALPTLKSQPNRKGSKNRRLLFTPASSGDRVLKPQCLA